MLAYALRRLLGAIPTIFIIVTAAFFMMRIAPGGPFDQERALEPTVMANLNEAFGLDRPLWEQYAMYLGNLLRGDMGPSFIYRDMRVHEILGQGLPVSMQLGMTALLLAFVIGTALGSIAALRQNTRADYGVIAVATFGITVPNFVVAPVLSLVFAVILSWLPAQGWGRWDQMILPVIALALPQVAVIARLIRGSMIEALRSDHVRTARAYGLPARMVVIKHALRAAVLPAISYLGPAAAALLTGSIVIEQVFNIPGIGRFFVNGALARDYTLVMGTVVIVAVFVVVFNLIVDLLYALLDPRVRYD
ncbi:oligopeptide ABC transporter permease OppB [Tranquillimonas alkanivorans]|uniref:Oligopeptide transport system permease protein n=1 Tax=Tranquillimonas alkanivorans TaxID=441119 RepID=A0A1I5RY95_9RHOB|nr:oligopeptide ABC transporter permease OppB [Tranquillimonas alkanivorans]SFP63443.1 oligopeptide transport system permease protein [Tranquillimonas alkanivorans]